MSKGDNHPPAEPTQSYAVIVYGTDTKPVVSAEVVLAGIVVYTNSLGAAYYNLTEFQTHTSIIVRAKGYQEYLYGQPNTLVLTFSHPQNIVIGGFAAPTDIRLPDLVPLVTKLQDLVVYRQFLGQADGTPITMIGVSDFNLLNRFDAGEDIDPILADRQGANYLRVWTAYDIPGIGTMKVCPYAKIPAFVSKCASRGFRVEFTAYTGINDPGHWQNLIAASLQCDTKPLLELVNELDQNTNEPDEFGRVFDLTLHAKPPAPLLSSHGSNGSETWPVTEYWDYVTFHTNGASEWWRKNGHNAMEIWNGPSLTDESTRCPDNDSNPKRYYDAAAGGSLLCAGTLFHSVSGKTSSLMDATEKNCFNNHVAGAKSVNLACQEGNYSHPQELEGPDDLRVYQRGSEVVHIGKNP